MLIKLLATGLLGGLFFSNVLPVVDSQVDYKDERVGTVYQGAAEFPQKKDPNNFGLITKSKSALVADKATNIYLLSKDERIKRPIASITKLMSVLVFLDYNIDWQKEVKYKKEFYREGSSIILRPGDKVTVEDLFHSALVTSANNAVAALVDAAGEKEIDFVKKMNEKARGLGMIDTRFFEPTGLSKYNQSTASDLTILLEAVLQKEEIVKILNTPSYKFETKNTKIGQWIFNNNYLLNSFINQGDYQVLAGKTGYTEEAGYCMVIAVKKNGRTLYVVVLGAASEEERFQEAKSLAFWAFNNFTF